jgi:hypothetical protein
MNVLIVYPNTQGSLTFLYPAADAGLSITEIARKDVPAGVPYLLVPDDLVPKDHTFFEAFEADFSTPNGYGIGQAAWFIEKYTQELDRLDPIRNSSQVNYLNQLIASLQQELDQ